MHPLIIRPMTAADIPATAKVLSDAFNVPAERMQATLEKPSKGYLTQAFVAVRGDKILGMTRCHKAGYDLSIEMLAVNKDVREQGLGRKLMKHTEKFIQRHWLDGDEGHVVIEDATKRHNPASRYYENMGYAPWFGNGNVGPLLYKTLKPS